MAMELSRAHYPVTVLGWGRRAGLWLQGCSIRCRGCMAKDTWARRPERAVPVPAIVDWLDSLGPLDGLTVSGGEPLDQAEELTLLLRAVRERWPSGFDVLCYTGRELGQAKAVSPELFELADAVAAGPFEPGCPPAPALSGL
ncbi:MAG: radical SAM protein, partial [Bifidobacteriaceae bacterium]|nr:radical SAM protein [Bifidobacteriaceae bacterium]